MHNPISIRDLCLSFPTKICFENFTTQVHFGGRIAIIGANGSGKSSLLNALKNKGVGGDSAGMSGRIEMDSSVICGYVSQLVDNFDTLSGGQRFNKALNQALQGNPNFLLLDEPTNHLDQKNRRSLMKHLKNYQGTLIVVSHDVDLLRENVTSLWHIQHGKIHTSHGHYDDYIATLRAQELAFKNKLSSLEYQKKKIHQSLMKEQQRASKSKAKGKKKAVNLQWAPVVGRTKVMQAEKTSGRKKAEIGDQRQDLIDQLSTLKQPEKITPHFSFSSQKAGNHMLVSIREGNIGYTPDAPLLTDINLSLFGQERIAMTGPNASGKSTLIKAILGNPRIIKTGEWNLPPPSKIGYLDQHYNTLNPDQSVLESISKLVSWPDSQVRHHLNDFLFRKNEEVTCMVRDLSGGEKARLCLAQIGACTPSLLILDEITNNLDLEMKRHVIEVLQHYPGALIVISHEESFLADIGITEKINIENWQR